MINIKKIIIPTICIAILSFVIGATDNKNSTKILDGVYTLSQIITQEGEVRNFTYGGELTVNDLKATFNTPTQNCQWELEKNSYEVIENGFIETSSNTNEKYVWMKINN
ncbi:hypothetical protein [Clostridium sp. 1001275B_160808_H3]|uniref:hypothetical protein n=1 Tax=Clostridium sp. 1001275B_160808_H3 TaxID=2787110 RepID=UPI001898375B|nr:hypothetical protein [Clostridium sp. 1001275B_160808_H3]